MEKPKKPKADKVKVRVSLTLAALELGWAASSDRGLSFSAYVEDLIRKDCAKRRS